MQPDAGWSVARQLLEAVVMSVSDAMETFLRSRPDIAGDPVAAAAAALALELDRGGDAAVAASFLKLMTELRRLAPAEEATDQIDDLSERRKRLLGRATA
jgi:hypothetical protein